MRRVRRALRMDIREAVRVALRTVPRHSALHALSPTDLPSTIHHCWSFPTAPAAGPRSTSPCHTAARPALVTHPVVRAGLPAPRRRPPLAAVSLHRLRSAPGSDRPCGLARLPAADPAPAGLTSVTGYVAVGLAHGSPGAVVLTGWSRTGGDLLCIGCTVRPAIPACVYYAPLVDTLVYNLLYDRFEAFHRPCHL